MNDIGFVTSNRHKFEEVNLLFTEAGLSGLYHIAMKYGEMQGETSAIVARQSAATLATFLTPPFIIEDSGLFVDSLNGFPGPYSSYVFSTVGYDGVLKLLADCEERGAHFFSVAVYVDEQGGLHTFQGKVAGTIARSARGSGGFGFDPIFVPEGFDLTFAELASEEKNRISHRGKSTKSLIDYLKKTTSVQV